MGGPLGVGKVKNCAPLLAVLFRDKTKRVNLKIFKGGGGGGGGFKGTSQATKLNLIKKVFLNYVRVLVCRGKVCCSSRKATALIANPKAKA